MTYSVNKTVNSRPMDTITNEYSTEISGQRVDMAGIIQVHHENSFF